MKKLQGPKYTPEDLARTKKAITRNLIVLEDKLKRFRSTSPEKWVGEIGAVQERTDSMLSARSVSDESTSSVNSEEAIKTIAENENFIKQKIGCIEDELKCLTTKSLPEGMVSLLEDFTKIEDGFIGLEDAVMAKSSISSADHIQDGILALRNALNEFADDARLVIQDESLTVLGGDLNARLDETIQAILTIDKMTPDNSNCSKLDFTEVRNKFKQIKSILNEIDERSSTLAQVHKGIDSVKEEVRTRIDDLINVPSKSNEVGLSSEELFSCLEEIDFGDMDSVVGYEITDFILRKEAEEIAHLRATYEESLLQLKIENKV